MAHFFSRSLKSVAWLLTAGLLLSFAAVPAMADDASQDYLQKKSVLKGDDQSGRYKLLLDFYVKNEKTQASVVFAKKEAEQLSSDFPDSVTIKNLLEKINKRVSKGEQVKPEQPETKTTTPPEKTSPKPSSTKTPKEPIDKDKELLPEAPVVGLLSAADQNLLRLYELNFSIDPDSHRAQGLDSKASVNIPKEVVVDFWDGHQDAEELREFKGEKGQARFRALPPLNQLDYLFMLQEKTLYPKVEVKTEPVPLQAFRLKIHPLLVSYFTKNFAGQIPGLIAKPKTPTSQVEAYTNFLALNLAQVDGHSVIDRDTPKKSLILQWGLPRDDADYPAPNIKGWKPAFKSKDDPKYVEIKQWIETLYGSSTPNYSISLPGSGDAKEDAKAGDKSE